MLVARAGDNDQSAWDALVDRYGPTVIAVCRRYRFSDADTADVRQTVWLRLLENLSQLREPEALPGWLVTTTRRECLRILKSDRRYDALPDEDMMEQPEEYPVDRNLLRAERCAALRAALAELPSRCQQLLRTLMEDPPPSYEEISKQLAIPIGSIGPTRARCLNKLRESSILVSLTEGDIDIQRARG